MGEIKIVERKSGALRHPSATCWAPYHTINLTAGCLCSCRYCYAQSFRHNPGVGNLIFYANTPDLIRRELGRMRRKPKLVCFSTGCEPFAPDPRVLRALFDIMKLLLDRSICIIALTKSAIPDEFLDLFSSHPGKTTIELGITTADDRIRQLMEPGAASVQQRLETLGNLARRGIPNRAKMDPLIPGLTDGNESFSALCKALAAEGVRDASASYLYIRPALIERMRVRTDGWSFEEMVRQHYTEEINDYCGHGRVQVAASEYRKERFGFMRKTAREFGIDLRFCRCKNASITNDFCHVLPKAMNLNERKGEMFTL